MGWVGLVMLKILSIKTQSNLTQVSKNKKGLNSTLHPTKNHHEGSYWVGHLD